MTQMETISRGLAQRTLDDWDAVEGPAYDFFAGTSIGLARERGLYDRGAAAEVWESAIDGGAIHMSMTPDFLVFPPDGFTVTDVVRSNGVVQSLTVDGGPSEAMARKYRSSDGRWLAWLVHRFPGDIPAVTVLPRKSFSGSGPAPTEFRRTTGTDSFSFVASTVFGDVVTKAPMEFNVGRSRQRVWTSLLPVGHRFSGLGVRRLTVSHETEHGEEQIVLEPEAVTELDDDESLLSLEDPEDLQWIVETGLSWAKSDRLCLPDPVVHGPWMLIEKFTAVVDGPQVMEAEFDQVLNYVVLAAESKPIQFLGPLSPSVSRNGLTAEVSTPGGLAAVMVLNHLASHLGHVVHRYPESSASITVS